MEQPSTNVIALQPELYEPGTDNNGNFIDKLPSNLNMRIGIKCPCSENRIKPYKGRVSISNHFKTRKHNNWMKEMNNKKGNLLSKNNKLEKTLKQQQKIISQQSNEISRLENSKNSEILKLKKDIINLKREIEKKNSQIDYLLDENMKIKEENSLINNNDICTI